MRKPFKPFRLRTERALIHSSRITGADTCRQKFLGSVWDKVEGVLGTVNGRATAHTFSSPLEVLHCLETAEQRRTMLGLSKRDAVGMRVHFVSGAPVANRYRWNREATHVVLQARPSGWFLEAVDSLRIGPAQGGTVAPWLTPAQAALVLGRFRDRNFSVDEG